MSSTAQTLYTELNNQQTAFPSPIRQEANYTNHCDIVKVEVVKYAL